MVQIAQFERQLNQRTLREMGQALGAQFQICALCSDWGCVIDLNQSLDIIKCEKCMQTWCVHCRKVDHSPNPCRHIKSADDMDNMRLAIAETIDVCLTHTCPYCKTAFIKYEGCNLITCASCRGLSCFLCKMKLQERIIDGTRRTHWHFYGSPEAMQGDAVCALYNEKDYDEAAYQRKQITKDCTKLIDSYKSNAGIQVALMKLMQTEFAVELPQRYKVTKSWWSRMFCCG